MVAARGIFLVKRFFSVIITFGAFLSLALLVHAESRTLNWDMVLRAPRFVALSVLACLVSVILSFLTWYFLFSRRLPSFSIFSAYRLYAVPAISRYLPGGQVWQYLGLMAGSSDATMGTWSVAAYAQSTLCSLLAGMILCISALRTWFPALAGTGIFVAYSLFISLFLLGTSSRWQTTLIRLLRKKYPSLPETYLIKRSEILFGTMLGIVAWGLSALAGTACLWIFDGKVDYTMFWPILSAYAVATFGAYFTFITPGGIGFREGFFVAILSRRVPIGEASFIALGAGFSLLIADLLFTLPILGRIRLSKSNS